MPNWTYNYLVVKGKRKDLDSFLEKVLNDEGYFDFNKIIPEPQTLEEYEKQGFKACDAKKEGIEKDEKRPWFNWYEWRWSNWDVKWNAGGCYVEKNEIDNGYITIHFDTPWNAPHAIMVRVAKRLTKNLSLEWEVEYEGEDGTDTMIAENNQVIQDIR